MKIGLTDNEVKQRIIQDKQNTLSPNITRTYKNIFQSNIFTFFNLLNIILFILVVFVQSYRNGFFIGTIICNTLIGIIQECRAKFTLDKLAVLNSQKVRLIRNSHEKTYDQNEIVLDDLMVLTTGDQVCCDSVVVDGFLEVNESLVTGEAKVIVKEKNDELISGSFIVSGKGYVRVIHVKEENYSYKILKEAKKYKYHRSKLQKDLDRLLKIISFIIVPLGLLLISNQYFFLEINLANSIIQMVAALVGMIPEGLIFLTSIAFAISVQRLAKKKILIQETSCIETLARIDTLCLDKTGTLTTGRMNVVQTIGEINEILGFIVYQQTVDNMTNIALKKYFTENNNYQVLDKIEFSSIRKFTAMYLNDGYCYYLGAMNTLLSAKVIKQINLQHYLVEGKRVIVLAKGVKLLEKPENLEYLGAVIISDSIKPDAQETINFFKKQNVNLKVISGDDPITVYQIAQQLAIVDAQKYLDVTNIEDQKLRKLANEYTVFGRVKPHQKKIILAGLQDEGHICAMTGDGVNDVLALKQADVSIAMKSGSDVTCNVANIVLLDSSFTHVPTIVDEGRRVVNNIFTASSMFLIKTTFSILLAILTIFFQQSYPLLPIQLTLIGTFSVGIPTFLLQFEPNFKRFEGNFVQESILKALPSSIIIVSGIIILTSILQKFAINHETINTIIVLYTGIIYSTSLYRIYAPLTRYRTSIIILMQFLFAILIYSFYDFLNLVYLDFNMYLILIIFSVMGISLMYFLAWLIKYLKNNI